jgi:hypothetical protein
VSGEHSYEKPNMDISMLPQSKQWKYKKLETLLNQLLKINEAERKTAQEFGPVLFQ